MGAYRRLIRLTAERNYVSIRVVHVNERTASIPTVYHNFA
jgi:hypothetical protein